MRQLFIMISIFYCFKTFSQQTDSTSGTQPDILLIVSSGHGFEDAGCYGNTFIKTPNIDKLAREGIRMDQAYHTSANMSSGFAELLTGLVNHASGQYGRANGSDHFSIFAEVRTLPSYLNQAG